MSHSALMQSSSLALCDKNYRQARLKLYEAPSIRALDILRPMD